MSREKLRLIVNSTKIQLTERKRLDFPDRFAFEELRINAQSTSVFNSSHITSRRVSRSMSIANSAEHGRCPQATLFKCPSVTPHLEAKSARSTSVMGRKNSLSCMGDYHHTMNVIATSNGEFQGIGPKAHNFGMLINKKADIRRANLRRLIERDFDGNQSSLASHVSKKPSYINDILNPNSGRAFGEKTAYDIETKAGLLDGQLDIPNSPLTRRVGIPDADKVIKNGLSELSAGEKNEIAAHVNEILGRRRRLKHG